MSAEENKAIVRRFYEEWYDKHNEAIVDELISPDYVFSYSGPSGWTPVATRGPACVRELLAPWLAAFPDARLTIAHMLAEGDKVAVVAQWHGTHQHDYAFGLGGKPIKASGKLLALPAMNVLRLSGGKIVEEWEITNDATMAEELGGI